MSTSLKISSDFLPSTGPQVSEFSKGTTNVPGGMGHAPTTQVPASCGEEALRFITRCWNAVTNGGLFIWRGFLGITTWVWDCVSSPFRCRIITVAERPRTFQQLVEEVDARLELIEVCSGKCMEYNVRTKWTKKESKRLEAQLRVAYDALPKLLQIELNKQIQDTGHQFSQEVSVLDVLVKLSCKISPPELVACVYSKC